jgi:tetratricopeptide (TPR) repeat protein
LWLFWQVRGHHTEGRIWLEQVLGPGGGGQLTGPPAPTLRAAALHGLGALLTHQGNYAAARSVLEESLDICRRVGDEGGMAWSLNGLGWVAIAEGDFTTARDLHGSSLAIARRLGDQRSCANSLNGLGWSAIMQGDHDQARILLDESLVIGRDLGDKRGITNSLVHLGWLAQAQGDQPLARAFVEESLAISQELGDRSLIADALEVSAKSAVTARETHLAARLLGAAHALREAIGAPLPPSDRAEYDDDVRAVRTALGDRAFTALWDEGRTMDLEQTIACALEDPGSA